MGNEPDASSVPLLWERSRIDGRATAYVCHGFSCRLPVTEPAALAAQLAHRVGGSLMAALPDHERHPADPKALLFDLDGTLVDTVGYRVEAWFDDVHRGRHPRPA